MQHLLILFFATYGAALVATLPPGLLNMNAAKTSIEFGKRAGLIFGLGVGVTILAQAYVAVLISKYLDRHPEVVFLLMEMAVGIFAGLALFFFWKGKKKRKAAEKVNTMTKKHHFINGVVMALLNLLTIPYYSGLNIFWNASGWIKFEFWDIFIFMMAAALGSFTVMYLYAVYIEKLDEKNSRFSENSNYILGGLMLVLLVLTLLRIYFS